MPRFCDNCKTFRGNIEPCDICGRNFCVDCRAIKGMCKDCFIIKENKNMITEYLKDKALDYNALI